MSIDLSQFIPTFLEESFEGLALMESGLLNIEAGDNETIDAIFRAAHSIKGGAGTFGFNRVTDFTHQVETLLDQMRDGSRSLAQTDVNILLQSVDCIKLLIECARDGIECDDLVITQVESALTVTLEGSSELCYYNDEPELSEPTISDNSGSESRGWKIAFKPQHQMLQTGNEPKHLFSAREELGALSVVANSSDVPPLAELAPEECFLHWQLELVTSCDKSEVIEIFEWVEDDCELEISPLSHQETPFEAAEKPLSSTPVVSSTPTSDKEARSATPNPIVKDSSTTKSTAEGGSIRVAIDKVDALINRIGELVITQAMLKQIGSQLSDDDEVSDKLREGLVQLESHTRELQEDVMRIRMLPISFVFNRFPRMVHDISAQLGKKIELKLSGEQTELDKTVMEKIGDPLTHLVRNSLDHGLEFPEERLAAGKDETGVVQLSAYHQGGYIVIDISDDGRGLDTDKIYAKALEKGLITPEQNLSTQEINQLIIAPGFSTAEAVSDLSGRGVGMDVVRRNIESLGGHVSLTSAAGQGSSFSVSLPLTLAILDGQLIKVATETYVVPLISIVESVQLSAAALNAIAGKQSLYLFRDEYIPLYNMRQLFALPGSKREHDEEMAIIVESGGSKFALVVDELLSQQQVVLKSLEANYMAVEGVSGATILGDGEVALIIDIKGLASLYRHHAQLANRAAQQRCAATIEETA